MKQMGFTLVEISLVMIIIGLLIGGAFGGMALIENMKVTSTIQQIKNIESGAIKFKDTYGTIPGDLKDPTVTLPNCNSAPCSSTLFPFHAGDGALMSASLWTVAIGATNERFVFWHQLKAVGLMEGVQNTTSLLFGEGQPNTAIDTGIRMFYDYTIFRHGICLTNIDTAAIGGTSANDLVVKGTIARKLDEKLDDGDATIGRLTSWNASPANPVYDITTNYGVRYLYNF